jgi:hypothetical protein
VANPETAVNVDVSGSSPFVRVYLGERGTRLINGSWSI